jgi:hypothetical protein
VFVNGAAVRVPAGVGINIHDPGVHSFHQADGTTAYGGIQRCATPCISPLHTHDDTGILHTESPTAVPNSARSVLHRVRSPADAHVRR